MVWLLARLALDGGRDAEIVTLTRNGSSVSVAPHHLLTTWRGAVPDGYRTRVAAPRTVPFVVDGCSINGAAGLVVPAAPLRRTVLRFAVCGWVPSGIAWSYAPYGVAGESLRVLSHSHGLQVGQ